MPANSGYDGVPMIDPEDAERYWKNVGHSQSGKKQAPEGNSHIPDTRIQIFPQSLTHVSSSSPSRDSNNFPKERRKAIIAFFLMVFGFVCNSVSIVLTHQKVPDRTLHPPLPDITLDNIAKRRWLNDLADILVILCTVISALLIILHRHRWILCRRVFTILSVLYSMRSVTMYATVLPLANTHVFCSPKMNTTFSFGQSVQIATEEVIKLIGAGGLPITGRKTMCGDYIFSGHTIIVLMAYLLIREYVPKRLAPLQWGSWAIAWVGMLCLLASHGHYTIDVIIAYYATTRLFWMYHTFSNNAELKRKSNTNSLAEVWWFPIFQYFEGNVRGPIPKEFAIPRFKRKTIAPGTKKEFYE